MWEYTRRICLRRPIFSKDGELENLTFIKALRFRSLRFKFVILLLFFSVLTVASIFGIMRKVLMQMEETLIANRLVADINYIEDLIGSGDWNIKSDAIHRGDTPIGDGTEAMANFRPFLEHERKTGTFSYVFIKRNGEGLGYVEGTATQKGYRQGHYLRVAGSTKDPNGQSIVGTYIDKQVADALDEKGFYEGEANVAGGMIYCRYNALRDKDGNIVGAIVVGRNISELQRHVREIVRMMSIGMTAAILLLGGILFLSANRWISMINKIVNYLKIIEEGSIPDEPLVSRSRDEMGMLVTEINHMVDSLREKEILRRNSEIDQLTGLANRFGLNRHFEEVFEDCYKNGSPLAVGIMDIDFFKPFNDNYGHRAGDECIAMLAEILKDVERKTKAFCARFGGDEFLIVCNGLGRDAIEAIAQEIKDRVLEKRVPHAYSQVSDIVTLSQGYCCGVPTQYKKLNDYIYMADSAMYEVKKSTKNSFKLAEMPDAFRPNLSGRDGGRSCCPQCPWPQSQ